MPDSKMYFGSLQEIGYEDMDWTVLAQKRSQFRALVKAAMNFPVHISKVKVKLSS
jgi:hypothetical protein